MSKYFWLGCSTPGMAPINKLPCSSISKIRLIDTSISTYTRVGDLDRALARKAKGRPTNSLNTAKSNFGAKKNSANVRASPGITPLSNGYKPTCTNVVLKMTELGYACGRSTCVVIPFPKSPERLRKAVESLPGIGYATRSRYLTVGSTVLNFAAAVK